MRCMNCGAPINDDGETVLSVVVCSTCATLARRSLEQLEDQLKQLMVLAQEAVRISLIRGELGKDNGLRKRIPQASLMHAVQAILAGKGTQDGDPTVQAKMLEATLPGSQTGGR